MALLVPSCSLLRALSVTSPQCNNPPPPGPSPPSHSVKRAQLTATFVTLPLVVRAVIVIFLPLLPPIPLSFSQSSFYSFSPGANVYISCNRLLRGAPEFILQPVVMAHFLDESWQHSCCWFLTCVHPFISSAVRSSLLFPLKTNRAFSRRSKANVGSFDVLFICLLRAVWAL